MKIPTIVLSLIMVLTTEIVHGDSQLIDLTFWAKYRICDTRCVRETSDEFERPICTYDICLSGNDTVIASITTGHYYIGDTDCIVYDNYHCDTGYILSMTFGDNIENDTLYKIYSNRDNWNNIIDKWYWYSARDSILVLCNNIYYRIADYGIYRIGGVSSNASDAVLIRSINNVQFIGSSNDYRELYFHNEGNKSSDSFGLLYVYDIGNDSLWIMEKIGYGVVGAVKMMRNSPLYYTVIYNGRFYLKYITRDDNIFTVDSTSADETIKIWRFSDGKLYYYVNNRQTGKSNERSISVEKYGD